MDGESTRSPSYRPVPRAAPSRRRLVIQGIMLAATVTTAASLAIAVHRMRIREQPVLDLLESMANPDPTTRAEARRQLIGSPEIHAPTLVGVLRRGKTRWQTQILPWLEDIPQISSRRTRQIRLERHAIEVLQRMGPAAAPSVLGLLSETRYGGRDTAIAILRAYGTNVLPVLVAALDDPHPTLRAGAVQTLGKFPSDQLGTLVPFQKAARDSQPSVRTAAIWALGQMQDRPAEVVPDLVSALSDASPQVQIQAASALRSFGGSAALALPALRQCLGAPVDLLRTEAALTLVSIGGTRAREAEHELLAAMRQREGPSSRQAACTLVALDLHTSEAIARLESFLRHRDSNIRSRTLDTLRSLGPRGMPLVPTIVSLLENQDERDNRAALSALRSIHPDSIPERFRQGRRRTAPSP